MYVTSRVALVVTLAASAPARADHSCPQLPDLTAAHAPDAVALARQLFTKGLELQKAGKQDEACRMFESSLVLEPQLGNLLNVADCRERTSSLVEAHALFVQAADLAAKTGDRREGFARERAQKLETSLVRITVRVGEPGASGLALRIAGCPLSAAAELHRVAEPGTIIVDASAPGRRSFHIVQTGVAGGELAVEIPALLPERDAQAERKAKEAEALAAVERRKAEELATARVLYDRHPARRWAVIGAGLGAAALVTGGLFGYQARRAQSSFDSTGCGDPMTRLSTSQLASCKSEQSRGQRDAALANGLWIGGGAMLVGAIALFVIDPGNVERPPSSALRVAPSSIEWVTSW